MYIIESSSKFLIIPLYIIYTCTCRYDREIKSGRKLGAKKGVAVGLSTAYIFFLLFASYAFAFW